jgi:hypothetical protein
MESKTICFPSDDQRGVPLTKGPLGERNHFQHSHKPLGGVAQFTEFLFQDGEKPALQDVGELRDLLAKSKLQMGLRVGLLG